MDIVIEAVPEIMDLKKEVFMKLDANTRPDTLICTNTSGLNIEINNGRGYYGSSSAGPVVLDVLVASLEYLGVRPDVDPTIVAAED